MGTLDYFEVECPEEVAGEYYKKITSTVLLDHDLVRVVSKIHIFIDPKVPIFVAVGITKRLPSVIRVNDFASVNTEDHKVTISISDEKYLAPFLRILWDKFGQARVEQPDRFTVILPIERSESEGLRDLRIRCARSAGSP